MLLLGMLVVLLLVVLLVGCSVPMLRLFELSLGVLLWFSLVVLVRVDLASSVLAICGTEVWIGCICAGVLVRGGCLHLCY